MVKPRIPETSEGIQGEFDTRVYDTFARNMCEKGWIETDSIIKSGIDNGKVLEIGSGPGYLGLDFLKKTSNTTLTGLEISKSMITIAKNNAAEYEIPSERITYTEGNAMETPFPADHFDAVISSGSLHEWEEPVRVFNEIHRVLKTGGRYYICDLRRDLPFFVVWFLKISVKPTSMRAGLQTSLQAAYTKMEIEKLLADSSLKVSDVNKDFTGISISGEKK